MDLAQEMTALLTNFNNLRNASITISYKHDLLLTKFYKYR
ncbi:hypothetical protein IFVP18_C150625 [Vibrio parahaemolyticus]